MCLGFIAAATNTGKTVLKSQTADGLYYAARYLSCMASAMVRPEQEASPQWQPRGYQMGRWLAGRLMKELGWSVASSRLTGVSVAVMSTLLFRTILSDSSL
jgi:putative transposase